MNTVTHLKISTQREHRSIAFGIGVDWKDGLAVVVSFGPWNVIIEF